MRKQVSGRLHDPPLRRRDIATRPIRCQVHFMKAIAVLVALLLVSLLSAQTPPAPPPESRQFDFWIGDWEVFSSDGKKQGENRIERMADGWGLLENWTAANGTTGKSLNTWTPRTKRWQQFWVSAGGALELAGGLNDKGEMVLEGRFTRRDGQEQVNRITWTPNPDDTVRQHWQSSSDGGATWTTSFDGLYRKRKK
jgi:hypothetical protein